MKHLRPSHRAAAILLLGGLSLLGACSRPTPASAPAEGGSQPTEALPPPMAPADGGEAAPSTQEGYPDMGPTEAPTPYPDGPTSAP